MPRGCLCVLNQTVCIMNNFYSIRISAQIVPTQWALAQMGLDIDAILQAPPAGSGRSAGGSLKGQFVEGHQVIGIKIQAQALRFLPFSVSKKPKKQQPTKKTPEPSSKKIKSKQNKNPTKKIPQTLEFTLGCTNNLADLLRQMLSCRRAPAAKGHKLPKPAWLNPPDHQGSCLVLRVQPKGQSSQGNHSI